MQQRHAVIAKSIRVATGSVAWAFFKASTLVFSLADCEPLAGAAASVYHVGVRTNSRSCH